MVHCENTYLLLSSIIAITTTIRLRIIKTKHDMATHIPPDNTVKHIHVVAFSNMGGNHSVTSNCVTKFGVGPSPTGSGSHFTRTYSSMQ